ncbi:peptidase C39 family protein [Actinomadura keratinilytica]
MPSRHAGAGRAGDRLRAPAARRRRGRTPYYGQTTSFTCGAVTALVAQAHAGALERRRSTGGPS